MSTTLHHARTPGLWVLVFLMVGVTGCTSSRPYTLEPIKETDADTLAIRKPEPTEENDLWDRVEMTLFYPLEKVLDLGWDARQVGRALGVADKREADNVNVLGEPPNSSWYKRRHYYHPMTPEELARGPNTGDGPDRSGPWTVVSGKLEGASPGFVIEDAAGDRYLLKFGRPPYQELSSAAEMISTKILYAAGYHVPENYITYFDPDGLRISPEAMVDTDEGLVNMTPRHLQQILDQLAVNEEGRIRALASLYLEGQPVGPWEFLGVRESDPNDRVWHQHRRELRGLRVISAWLNDADRRSANTLAVYTDDRYLKHYLIDMGSTLGANGAIPHSTKHGQEYLYDPAMIFKSIVGLGFYDRPWLFLDREEVIPWYPSVGYFEAKLFEPDSWKPVYPNPAFERTTLRDAFWGAKIVMSFNDEDLRAIVETGQITNPEAEAYLLEVLKNRRDEIGRYYFGLINPLDRFELKRTGEGLVLTFDDLAVESDLVPASAHSYVYGVRYNGELLHREPHTAEDARLPLFDESSLPSASASDERVVTVKIQTRRQDGSLSKLLTVYAHVPPDGAPRVVGVHRQDD